MDPKATSSCDPLPLTASGTRHASTAVGWVLALVLAAAVASVPPWPLDASHVARAQAQPRAYVEIHVLDVGQGDATLILGTAGQVVLYDAGRNGSDVPAALAGLGITELDLLVLSHQHADHIGGAEAVLERLPVRFVMWNELEASSQVHARTIESIVAAGAPTLAPTRRRIGLGDAALHVLPPTGDAGLGQDDNTVGLVVQHGAFRMIVAGDAHPAQWAAWLDGPGEGLAPVQVLRASHHGSRTGDTEASLAALRPEVVIISVGGNNAYGHPHDEALARYRRHAHTVLRTDERGAVVIRAWADGRFELLTER